MNKIIIVALFASFVSNLQADTNIECLFPTLKDCTKSCNICNGPTNVIINKTWQHFKNTYDGIDCASNDLCNANNAQYIYTY